MHLSREILYALVAFLAGGLLGTINGFCLFGAWVQGWIFPVPDSLASNDALSAVGRQRSKVDEEGRPGFAWSNKYDFAKDEIGNVTYKTKPIPYAGDGE